MGRLDNSAVSSEGAKMSFKNNEVVKVEVATMRVDEVVGEQKVVLIKIDVQGWELHVLKGAEKVLARERGEAPYVLYEEDERLLKASNTTAEEIRGFMMGLGYRCERQGDDQHCTKD